MREDSLDGCLPINDSAQPGLIHRLKVMAVSLELSVAL